ncbi:hypothetical protein jhhlp_002060 [Lomentospora prolificans]|uniref:J domain-containing protein n=1 Tax=Lomentospora prolificans TaxID=41688 RepID=A0A2N3ND05_9PEZI|nr:hypothetical protein jhhlp_002060 [Lomentospora prolificans]
MEERGNSPRRRHILASINQEPPKDIRDSESAAAGPQTEDSKDSAPKQNDEDRSRRRRRLKLKDHKSHRSSRHRSSRERSSRRDGDDDSWRRRRRRRHRRSRSPTPPNPHEEPPLDPEAAFRESLFDAMADDEGAAYWEGVYGQPMHVYSDEKFGPQGELERMTDEEYAAYVRQKMWEKTHEGLLEERQRRENARKEREKQEKERRRLAREMERSLLIGEERRSKRRWEEMWEDYLKRWTTWDGSADGMPWPVKSTSRGDVSEDAVKTFFLGCLKSEDIDERDYAQKLKDERVRWHPDKIQQRLGGQVDEDVMKDVTAIFQTIDKLWNDTRRKEP